MEFFKFRRDIPFMRYALALNVVSVVTFVLAAIFLNETIDVTMIGFAVAVMIVVALGRQAAVGVRAS